MAGKIYNSRTEGAIERNVAIGIMRACEWTWEEIGLHFGVSKQAEIMRMRDPRARKWIEWAQSIAKVAISKHVEDRIKDAEQEIASMKKKIRTKSYRVIERTLEDGEDAKKIDARHLKAAEMGLDRTEGKAIDRRATLELSVHQEIRQVDSGDLEAILAEQARLNELRAKALPALPEFKEAEVIE